MGEKITISTRNKNVFCKSACLFGNDLMIISLLQEVEREISFRTESGLYYSYYKQMVQAPSIAQGKLGNLKHSLDADR
jgi:hypothetical protein